MTTNKETQAMCRIKFRNRMVILLALAAIISAFFVPGWGSHGGRIASYSHDLAHFPLFAAIAAGLLGLWQRKKSAVAKAGIVVLLALGLILLIEYFQPMVGRTAAFSDVLLGAAGAFATVCVYLALRTEWIHGRRFLFAGTVMLSVVAIMPLLLIVADWYKAQRGFPVIDSFERPIELGRWVTDGCLLTQTRDHVTDGKYAMSVLVQSGDIRYPSVFLADGPMDWRGFGRLALDVFLKGEESRTIWIRADDRSDPPFAERSQMAVDLRPGMNTIWLDLGAFSKTPGGSQLNLGHVQTVGLFFENGRVGDELVLDRMVLSARKKK